MGSTIAGIATILLLGGWHLRTRRHWNWRNSREARFYITTAYPLVGLTVFFLVDSADGTDAMWIAGCLCGFVAATMFTYGFQLLDAIPAVPASPQQHPDNTRIGRLGPDSATFERQHRSGLGITKG